MLSLKEIHFHAGRLWRRPLYQIETEAGKCMPVGVSRHGEPLWCTGSHDKAMYWLSVWNASNVGFGGWDKLESFAKDSADFDSLPLEARKLLFVVGRSQHITHNRAIVHHAAPQRKHFPTSGIIPDDLRALRSLGLSFSEDTAIVVEGMRVAVRGHVE